MTKSDFSFPSATNWQTQRAAKLALELESARRCFRHFVPLFFRLMNPNREFIPDVATDAIADHLQAVRDGQIDSLLVLTPPGTLKSFTTMVAFPAWTWIDWPQVMFLCASGSEENAKRDSVKCRDLILSELYQRAYINPTGGGPFWRLRGDVNAVEKFENTLGGLREIATCGQTATGRKGDIQLIDDAMDARKVTSPAYRRGIIHWHDTAFWNRVNDDREARRVVIGQHVDREDLQSHLIRKGGYVVLRLPEQRGPTPCSTHIWTDPRPNEGDWLRPLRHGPAEKTKAVRSLGPAGYETQHNQNPRRTAGKLFDRARVGNWFANPPMPLAKSLRYWDVASSKDENACWSCGILGGFTETGRLVILHAARGHWEPDEFTRQVRGHAQADARRGTGWNYSGAWVERQPAAAGKWAAQGLLKATRGLSVNISDHVTGDKFNRAAPLMGWWSEGLVDVVDDPEWTPWFIDYMEAFERGAAPNLLDVGDAASGMFNTLSEGASGGTEPGTEGDPEHELADAYRGRDISGSRVMDERF
jgi:predicted phage terminase large subunit-like protein